MAGGGNPDDGDAPDQDLWQRVTEGVRPLKKRSPPSPSRPPSSGKPAQEAAAPVARPRRTQADLGPVRRQTTVAPPELAPGVAAGLDKRTLAKLRRGLISPERRIDLHNMTQSQAHLALDGFLAAAQAAGKRCVLVITGKGTRADGTVGVLRTNVPHWLNQPGNRARILAFTHAAPGDGGEGALYVLLRRLR